MKRAEIPGIVIRKERFPGAQRGIMHAQIAFDHAASRFHKVEAFLRAPAVAIIPPQIKQRLFALEDGGTMTIAVFAKRRHISAIPAMRQTHLHGAGGIASGLRPNACEAL